MNSVCLLDRFEAGRWLVAQDDRAAREGRLLPLILAMLLIAALPLLLNGYHWGFHSIQAWSVHLPGAFWESITVLGDERMLLALALPFYRRYPQIFWSILISAIIAGLLCRGIKLMAGMPRPAGVLLAQKMTIIGPRITAGSFPSGHSASIFAFVGVWIAFLTPRRLPLLFGVAIVAAFSRVAVGAHWPTDVMLGGALGLLSAWLGLRVSRYVRWQIHQKIWLVALMIVVLATCTLPFDGQGYSQSLYFRVLVSVLGLFFAFLLYRGFKPQWEKAAFDKTVTFA